MPSSFFALFDDIASLLDDVAAMTKTASAKTAGVLGDDLALNAQQVAGVRAERELPVVWAVAKGSLVNKAILVPAALAISALLPWAITPLLMLGGLYLCFEGAEKVLHPLLHHREAEQHEAEVEEATEDPALDLVAFEREKIKGAIRTDFVLSAEIIVIALGTVAQATFPQRVMVLTIIALVMTIGVYGVVAAIVKLDDLGLHLTRKRATAAIGRGLLWLAPLLMRVLSVVGTLAMFMVGGGILAHGLPMLHHTIGDLAQGPLGGVITPLANAVAGLIAGAMVVAIVQGIAALRRRR
ncbi:DUF808 domain-containing protein [Solilutibacter silvestris]|uniref:DUF808 domain-containing protein n=1 Tax=Solilutibacter silvestris TaxID=1645665 RepID=A0A2K1Q400_9GAMM|nr:DUF808 domain-containing protein [Lysobacter silvestris]PNS09782.1 hypothetical protein Lysil_1411 [Lysobacter silvestris]